MADAFDVAAYIAETTRATLETTRATLEPIWCDWKRVGGHPDPYREPPSHDTCIPTSFVLCEMLNRCVQGWHWKVVGGRPTKRTPKGGFWLPDGQGGGHLWVEGSRARLSMTVDITCDQFGGDLVFIHEGISPYHHANGTKEVLERYQQNEKLTIELWIAAIVLALEERAQVDA